MKNPKRGCLKGSGGDCRWGLVPPEKLCAEIISGEKANA